MTSWIGWHSMMSRVKDCKRQSTLPLMLYNPFPCVFTVMHLALLLHCFAICLKAALLTSDFAYFQLLITFCPCTVSPSWHYGLTICTAYTKCVWNGVVAVRRCEGLYTDHSDIGLLKWRQAVKKIPKQNKSAQITRQWVDYAIVLALLVALFLQIWPL